MLNEFVKGLNQSFWELIYSGSRKVNLPMTISVQPRRGETIWNLDTGKLVTNDSLPNFKTETLKVSKDSLSFIVPNIRFNNANLAGEGRVLNIELELPEGAIKLEAVGEHYERIGKRTSLANYLIEAKIVYLNPLDRAAFQRYLRRAERKNAAPTEGLIFETTQR